VGAGALVTGKTNAPAGSLLLGSPAKVVKQVTEEQIAHLRRTVVWMAAVIAILAALLATACIMLFPFAGDQETSSVGKNYTYDSNFAPNRQIEIVATVEDETYSILVSYDEDLLSSFELFKNEG
jgi:hypothetical protein